MGDSRFLTIGITAPDPSDAEIEASAIESYLSSDAISYFHIRKPLADESYVRRLLNAVPVFLWERLILHSHYKLYSEFKLGGFHLKNDSLNLFKNGDYCQAKIMTRSCHSINELEQDADRFTYSFLSPVFDSISKKGYKSRIHLDNLELVKINERHNIIALGGVTPEKLKKLFDIKFGGAALLGYLWSPNLKQSEKIEALLNTKRKLTKYQN